MHGMTRLTVPVLIPKTKTLSKADSDGGASAAEKIGKPSGPQVASTPKPNIKMSGLSGPKLHKLPGESGEQAVTRHLDEHDAHLRNVESLGMTTPRGHATVMMGLPGSGKSHYLKQHHLAGDSHVHVDVDALKALAPGEKDFKYPSHYPEGHDQAGQPHPQAGQQIMDPKYDDSNKVHVAAAHPVSKRLEQGMFEQAKARRLPVALDTTGGNHKKWGERMKSLRDSGYHQVNLVHVRVSKQTSMARNAGRSRQVPQSVINDTLAEHEPTHPDNGGKTPFHILSQHADNVHLIDHEPAGTKHPRGVAGMDSRPDSAAKGWDNFRASEAARGGTMQKAASDEHHEMMVSGLNKHMSMNGDYNHDVPTNHKLLPHQVHDHLANAYGMMLEGTRGKELRPGNLKLAAKYIHAAHECSTYHPELKQHIDHAQSVLSAIQGAGTVAKADLFNTEGTTMSKAANPGQNPDHQNDTHSASLYHAHQSGLDVPSNKKSTDQKFHEHLSATYGMLGLAHEANAKAQGSGTSSMKEFHADSALRSVQAAKHHLNKAFELNNVHGVSGGADPLIHAATNVSKFEQHLQAGNLNEALAQHNGTVAKADNAGGAQDFTHMVLALARSR